MSKRFYRYYYSLLNDKNKKAYDQLYEGFSNMKLSFRIDKINNNDLKIVYEYLMLDNPLIFYLNSYTYYTSSDDIVIKPDYLYSEADINNYLVNIKSKCQIYRNINGLSDYDFIIELNTLFKKNMVYHLNQSHNIHTIIGSLFNKKAVCDGIAKLFKLVCDLNNITCIVVTGQSNRSYDRASFYNHAWNKVMINGDWFNIDITANMTIGDYVRHDYLFLSDNAVKKSHIEREKTPECIKEKMDYYTISNLVFNNKILLFEYLEDCLKRGIYNIEFKIPHTKDINSLTSKVMDVLKRVKINKSLSFNIEYNLDQLVFYIYAV